MGNRAADLEARPLDIDMDPLTVARRTGKAVDLLQAYEAPVRGGQRRAGSSL